MVSIFLAKDLVIVHGAAAPSADHECLDANPATARHVAGADFNPCAGFDTDPLIFFDSQRPMLLLRPNLSIA